MLKLKNFISWLINFQTPWIVLQPFAKLGTFLTISRNEIERRKIAVEEKKTFDDIFYPIFINRKVLHGPFKGISYPELNSIGSTLYSKLIGSYESELHEVIERVCTKEYSEILNIGCGEGYYAIGFSLRIPGSKTFAYDTAPEARRLCFEMACLNGVKNRIEIHSTLTSEDLKCFRFTKKGFIMCDCEGFELELFNESNIDNLKNCDLLIETHDFIDISISTKLATLFSSTHDINFIKSKDDIEKAKTYYYPETEFLSLPLKKALFAEKRPAIMEWIFLSSRANL